MPTLQSYFQYSPASSFRMVNENPVIDPRFNNRSVTDLVDISPIPYNQPWQTNDINARLMWFTAYTNDVITICAYYTNVAVQSVPITSLTLLSQQFVCKYAEPDFSDIGTGKFYIRHTYTDENNVVQDYRSSPLNIQVSFPNTMLYQATNNKNEKNTIFLHPDGVTPFTWSYRVEAAIREPTAKNASQNFDDEYWNLTQLSYIPFENYVNYIGIGLPYGGLPFWVVKLFNFVYSLDNIQIEEDFFSSTGEEFKPTRATNQKVENGYWAITIQPVYQKNYAIYKTGTPLPTTFKVIELSDDYIGQTENIVKAGLYKNGIEIVGISGNNYTGDAFTMTLSTNADGSNPIGTIEFPAVDPNSTEIDKNAFSENFKHYFNAIRTLYVTGLNGLNLDLHFRYIDYNAPNYTPPDNSSKFVENTVYSFLENDPLNPVFAREFDIATGLGNAGTDHENCVIIDMLSDKYLVGFDRTQPATLGTRVGNVGNQLTLLPTQMPPHQHLLANGDTSSTILTGPTPIAFSQNAGIKRDYGLTTTSSAPNRGLSSAQLDANGNVVTTTDPTPIQPDSYVVAMFKYVKP